MRMATYDLDPDVTRWGLHLLDRDMSQIEYVNKGYCENAYVENHEAVARALEEGYYENAYMENDEAVARALEEGYYEIAYMENDEAVARALQEEFTRIDSLEASGVSNVGAVLAQDWFGPSKRHYSTGNDSDKKDASSPGRNMEADDCSKMENDMLAEIGNLYSCFSPGEKSSYVEDFSNTLEITDEYGEVGTLTNNDITQYDRDMSQIEYVNEGYYENAYVENDEAVARALQEEFTRIDSLEAFGVSNVGAFLAQDWFGPSKRHYSIGNDSDKKDASSPGRNMEADEMENDMLAEIGNFYSCFGPREKSSYVEDFTNTLEITDESSLDGEVGKRLNQMIHVPVPKRLGKHVVSSKKAQANWYRKLLEAWREAKPPPVTPEEAVRLIIETLNTDQKADVEGLLTSYGLPLPHTLLELTTGVPTSLPTGVKYEFETLPVDAKAVADGDGMTVYVSTTDPRESSCIPSDVQMAAVQRSEARAEKNYVEANALHKRIIDSRYRVLKNFQNNEEILARKCRIRLRGIDAPENSMPYGEEAKKELTNIVQGKCLRVLVYGEDQYGRCVGDVYCNGEFVQELMLKKGLAWHYTAYDQRPELAKWEKEAQAKRVGLWASPNPEKPWEWRRDKRQVRERA